MMIALTPEIETALALQSQQRGLTPDELAQQILRDALQELERGENGGASSVTHNAADEEAEGTLADLLAGRIGTLRSSEHVPGGARLSEDTGRKFAAGMVEKKRQGKL